MGSAGKRLAPGGVPADVALLPARRSARRRLPHPPVPPAEVPIILIQAVPDPSHSCSSGSHAVELRPDAPVLDPGD
jgi:hypothetical protein